MNVHVQSSTNPKMCQVFDKVGLLFITADISLEDFQEFRRIIVHYRDLK